MRINNNISALNAWRGLTQTDNSLSKSLEKLSSGLRINRAGDDAAGLAISEKMRGQIKGLTQATRNAQDAISLVQTAEGALSEIHSIFQRMRELTVQMANGTNEVADKDAIVDEIKQLSDEIDGIAHRTEFNGKTLLDGSWDASAEAITFQIGANASQSMTLNIGNYLTAINGAGLHSAYELELTDYNGGSTLDATPRLLWISNNFDESTGGLSVDHRLQVADKAIEAVSKGRSELGALQNRLEHTISNLGVAAENLTAAESRIRDVDMAAEMMTFTKQNILSQAGTAMMAQANARPQSVLQLLG